MSSPRSCTGREAAELKPAATNLGARKFPGRPGFCRQPSHQCNADNEQLDELRQGKHILVD